MKNYKLDIALIVPGLPFTDDTVRTKSLGGSESAGLYMARALTARGHNVIVFSNGKPGTYNGIRYMSIQEAGEWLRVYPFDVAICQRVPEVFQNQNRCKMNILWNHDLALKRSKNALVGALWNIDKIFTVSEWHKKQTEQVYGLPEGLVHATRNGLDSQSLPKQVNGWDKRKPWNFVYAARPERGLDNLVFDIAPKLIEKHPETRIHITTYDNPVKELEPLLASLHQGMARYPSNFMVHKPMTKKELFKLYNSCVAYLYPTEFEEVSCISAMEAMACGLPFVTGDVGALPETLGDAGYIVPDGLKAKTSEYNGAFVNLAEDLCTSQELWEAYSKRGIERAAGLAWDGVAEEWERVFYEHFEKQASDPVRTARHFVWHSDIEAAEYVLKDSTDPRAEQIRSSIKQLYPYKDNTAAYKKFYESLAHGAHFSTGRFAYGEERLTALIEWFRSRPELHKATVLDYGCAHGGYSVALSNEFPELKVTGLDISADLVRCGIELAAEDAKHPENLDFVVLGEDGTIPGDTQYDVIICCEVLEHVKEPWELLNTLESRLVKSGTIVGTVPFGMRDQEEVRLKGAVNPPVHLWEFDNHDLSDMMGHKKQFKWGTVLSKQPCLIDLSAQGWWFFSYQKTDEPAKPVDMERKCFLQRPQHSISACLITGDAEDMLLRCLKSLRPYVDEIVVLDTGSTDRTVDIARQFADKVVISRNKPLEVGFATVRNECISYASGDWILWIDSDEALAKPQNLRKYLRNNIFKGYGIRHHHFTVDPEGLFKPDLPTRVFRNNGGIKFFGVIHEHPETGLNEGILPSVVLSDVHIPHDGYISEEQRRGRFHRNYRLMLRDQEENPDRILGKLLMMRDWLLMVMYIREQTGGAMTHEAVEYCEKVIRMYEQDFEDRIIDISTGVNPLMYYTQAMQLLGRGVPVQWSVGVPGSQETPSQALFRDRAQAEKYIGRQLENHFNDLGGRYQ